MKEEYKYDIFLSHSSKDNDFADMLWNLLDKSGFKVWYDNQSLLLGTNLEEIIDKLKSSRFVIVVWTKDAEKSLWVKKEATNALKESKCTVIVVRLDWKKDYPEELKDLQNIKWLDCSKGCLTPKEFFHILASIYGTSENTEFDKDVFVTLSWEKKYKDVFEKYYPTLSKEFRLIGDYPDQKTTDEHRITKIMGTCRGYIAILTPKANSDAYLGTSKYFWKEIKWAYECELPGLLIADPNVYSKINELKSCGTVSEILQLMSEKGWFIKEDEDEKFKEACIEALGKFTLISFDDEGWENYVAEFSRSVEHTQTQTPHIYYTKNTNIGNNEINSCIKRLCGIVTAIPCKDESDSVIRVNTSIIDRIKENISKAYLMISDVSNAVMDRYVDIGIAIHADIELFLFKQQDSSTTSSYIVNSIYNYQDGCECLALIHKILRQYRRKVIVVEPKNNLTTDKIV